MSEVCLYLRIFGSYTKICLVLPNWYCFKFTLFFSLLYKSDFVLFSQYIHHHFKMFNCGFIYSDPHAICLFLLFSFMFPHNSLAIYKAAFLMYFQDSSTFLSCSCSTQLLILHLYYNMLIQRSFCFIVPDCFSRLS